MAIKKLDFANTCVLVTGASSGLGEQIARELARRGASLVLAARRGDRLAAIARSIEATSHVEVTPIAIDLAEPGAHDRLFEQATRGRTIYAAALNAARYWYGGFHAMPNAEIDQVLRLNVHAPIGLVHRLLPYLEERGAGGILVISSVGGLMPSPGQSLYSATKALLVAFVENLHFERGATPIALCVASPGGMWTEMMASSPVLDQLRSVPLLSRVMMMSPAAVARETLDAFERGERFVVPGARNRLLVALARFFPGDAVGRGAAFAYGVGRNSISQEP